MLLIFLKCLRLRFVIRLKRSEFPSLAAVYEVFCGVNTSICAVPCVVVIMYLLILAKVAVSGPIGEQPM